MESIKYPSVLSERLLRISVIFLLWSRAWQYLYWESPLRAVLWDEKLFAPYARRLGWTWAEWVSSPQAAGYIEHWNLGLGFVLLMGGLGALLPPKYVRASVYLLCLGGLVCLAHALLTTKANFGRIGHFIELSLQWMSPFLLVHLLLFPARLSRFIWLAKIAIAFTFVGHGLYAWGFYPVPGSFQQMMIDGFGMNNEQALFYLKLAGLLDFFAAAMLFLPWPTGVKGALVYIIVWGFLTAFARIWTHLGINSFADIAFYWVSEFGVRTVHFLVPLSVYLLKKRKKPYIRN